MGTPKALLAWKGSTLLEFALEQARAAAVDDVVVVLGPSMAHLDGSLGGAARAVINPRPETGRSVSIRLGSAALPDEIDAIVIQSVDQPTPVEVLRAMFAAVEHGDGRVAVPTYLGRRGHPVCFAGNLLPELRRVAEHDEGLRSVVRRHAAQLVEVPVNSESVLWNLNDPAAYAAAQARTE